jgi:hypothetical protein
MVCVIFVVPVGFMLIYSVSEWLEVDILTALPQLSDATLMTYEYPQCLRSEHDVSASRL